MKTLESKTTNKAPLLTSQQKITQRGKDGLNKFVVRYEKQQKENLYSYLVCLSMKNIDYKTIINEDINPQIKQLQDSIKSYRMTIKSLYGLRESKQIKDRIKSAVHELRNAEKRIVKCILRKENLLNTVNSCTADFIRSLICLLSLNPYNDLIVIL